MRDAARALDNVSDHLGEVLRRADQLLADWSAFGAQVRAQVEREAGAIGATVDSAVSRAAASGLDQAIADRLRSLTGELERLEQRAKAAARAVAEQRAADRRVLWIVVAGVVLANALLVMLLLRQPAAAPPVEPVRMEPPAQIAPAGQGSAAPAAQADGSGTLNVGSDGNAASPAAAGSGAGSTSAAVVPGAAGSASGSASAGSGAGSAATGKAGAATGHSTPSAVLPPKGGGYRPHKKM